GRPYSSGPADGGGRLSGCPIGFLCGAHHSAGVEMAAHRGHLSPTLANLHSPAPVRRRRRVLDRDELAALLPVLRTGIDAYAAARRFAALTGHVDVSGLHWRQIDLSAGTLMYRTKPAGSVSVH